MIRQPGKRPSFSCFLASIILAIGCGSAGPSDTGDAKDLSYRGELVEIVRYNYDGGNAPSARCSDGRECVALHRYALNAQCISTARYDCVPREFGYGANNNQVCKTYTCEEKSIDTTMCLAFRATVFENQPFSLDGDYGCALVGGCFGHDTTHNLAITIDGKTKDITYVQRSESLFPLRLKNILSAMDSVGL